MSGSRAIGDRDLRYAFCKEHVFRPFEGTKGVIERIFSVLGCYRILDFIKRLEYPVTVGHNEDRHDEREYQTDD